ncbi:DUF4157 domain-containing protein [uncultured Thiodictyon sp.]|uniref:eCIS core domain-containing protein n=1 Tax=uncultured Thiodictyon sp. TaxID=1846217 RepID=UPI0025D94AB9|nr:DUF4157 domain-containing protein [uncultured Thiodictyon sp.]
MGSTTTKSAPVPGLALKAPVPSTPAKTRLHPKGNRALLRAQRQPADGERGAATLRLGQPGDRFEQQAERIAERVLGAPVGMAPGPVIPHGGTRRVEPLPRSQGPGWATGQAVPAQVHEVLRSPGQPLEAATRQRMEAGFRQVTQTDPTGHDCDFHQVRIHTGARAAESAQAVAARAYTVGRDIVFSAGQYDPGTRDGQRLLAHELTHVTQGRPQAAAPTTLFRQPAAPAAGPTATPAPQPTDKPTKTDSVPAQWTWKDLAMYPLLVDVFKDLVLKQLTPGDRKLLALNGSEGAVLYAWTMAVGLAPAALAGGDKPKDFSDFLKATGSYADALTGLTPAKDSVMDLISRIVGLRFDDYLASDLFLSRLKTHTASVVALATLVQGVFSIVQAAKNKNDDPSKLEGDPWTQQTLMVKSLLGAIFKEQLKAPTFFDVGPLQLATHPAFSAAPFAGGGAPSGVTFERNQDVDGKVREQKYGLTVNLPKLIKPGDASVSDIGDPAKYRGWQGSAWFSYDSTDPLKPSATVQPGYKFKAGTIFGGGGHLAELEAGAQYGGDTGKELTAWFARGGYGYTADQKDSSPVKKIGFTATFIDWKDAFILAPKDDTGAAAGGWGLKTTPFVSTQFKAGDKRTIDASAAVSFVVGKTGDAKTSFSVSDVSVGVAYTYMGGAAPGQLPAFKFDLAGSMSRLDWWNPNSPLLWGLQARGNVGPAFAGVKVMTGAGPQPANGGGGIPEPRLDAMGPTVKTMVPTAVLFTGGYSF